MGPHRDSRPPRSRLSPRARCRCLGVLLLLLSGLLLAQAASASATSVTFLPGAKREFKVPVGVSSVEVTAVGGAGQRGRQCEEELGAGAGGSGALVNAVVPVSSGSTLLVQFSPGASGGKGVEGNWCFALDGGAGGGSSELLSEGSTALVVAGGGGGGGGSFASSWGEVGAVFEEGGPGGSASSIAGNGGFGRVVWEGTTHQIGGVGGEGGSAGRGGAGGSAEAAISSYSTVAGTGSFGNGGVGGGWPAGGGMYYIGGGGGGGGNGHYGGGGGGAGNTNGGGGGAGSSYMGASAGVAGTITSGAGKAQKVTIVYTVAPPPSATISSPAAGGVYNLNAVVRGAFSCVDGSGAPGIAACTDSNGGSGSSGVLSTATAGSHTYTVTARSTDGEETTASISYTVLAPVIPPVVATVPPAATAPLAPVAGATLTFSTAACVSSRIVTIFLAGQVTLPRGVKIVRAEMLLSGRLVAKLPGPYPVAHVSLVGLPSGSYTVTSRVRASNGRLLKAYAVFQTCTSGAAD